MVFGAKVIEVFESNIKVFYWIRQSLRVSRRNCWKKFKVMRISFRRSSQWRERGRLRYWVNSFQGR
jgi:hypothetical protein